MPTRGTTQKEITMQLNGYVRVSTPDQSLERQLDGLHALGSSRLFAEAASSKRGTHRPEWDACLAHLRAGDTLVIVELSHLGRNTGDLGRLRLSRTSSFATTVGIAFGSRVTAQDPWYTPTVTRTFIFAGSATVAPVVALIAAQVTLNFG
jgi:hypothetical protein